MSMPCVVMFIDVSLESKKLNFLENSSPSPLLSEIQVLWQEGRKSSNFGKSEGSCARIRPINVRIDRKLFLLKGKDKFPSLRCT